MKHESSVRERFLAALRAAGMPEAGREFSVVAGRQVVAKGLWAEIEGFVRVFDRVTGRAAWRAAAQREAPDVAQLEREEMCFFSAWDFHLPPEGGCWLIEFNDNGSGFLFAGLINALYAEAGGLGEEKGIARRTPYAALEAYVGDAVEREARAYFGKRPAELLLILDDEESLRQGKFRGELDLLCALLKRRGWRAEIGHPAETRWDGRSLTFAGQAVGFVVNRSTDFFWEGEGFSALRSAYEAGEVYVAPNPFSYATRSDKRLLEPLSQPRWDAELGVEPGERQILSAHAPEAHVLRDENIDMLAQRKRDFVFKPIHGFGGRGLLDSAEIGKSRLQRLLRHGEGYVAQRRIPKARVEMDGAPLWTDVRVWAYKGEIFLISGRASRREDRLDLKPPGGWLPTYRPL